MNPWIYVGLVPTDQFLALCKYRRVDEKSTRLCLEACATAFEVFPEDIMGASKTQQVAAARHAYCYVLHSMTRLSHKGISGPINRHYSTSINSVNVARDLAEVDVEFRYRLNQAVGLFKQYQKKNEVYKGY